MLVVMLVLLMTTATAVFAIHSTSSEMRAAGHARHRLQTQSVAETSLHASMAMVDRLGPQAILTAMSTTTPPDLTLFQEPPLLPGKYAYRMLGTDFVDSRTQPIFERDMIGGSAQPYDPLVVVDLSDDYVFTGVRAGERSDGYGELRYMHVTFNAHGRTRIPTDYITPGDTRPYNEGAADARAHGLSGPFAPR